MLLNGTQLYRTQEVKEVGAINTGPCDLSLSLQLQMSPSLGLVSVFPLRLVFLSCGFPEHAAVEGCKLVRGAGIPLPSQYSFLNSTQGGPREKPVRRRFGSIDCRLLVWVTAQSKKNEPGVNCQLSDRYRMKIIHAMVKAKRL